MLASKIVFIISLAFGAIATPIADPAPAEALEVRGSPCKRADGTIVERDQDTYYDTGC